MVNAMGFVGLTADDFGQGNTKNLANVDGPRAFEAFFESYLMTLGNKFIDSTSCIEYTNQTDVLLSLLKSISENIKSVNGSVEMSEELNNDLAKVNKLIIDQINGKCSALIDANVRMHLTNAIAS